jgi:hypothetical protein
MSAGKYIWLTYLMLMRTMQMQQQLAGQPTSSKAKL